MKQGVVYRFQVLDADHAATYQRLRLMAIAESPAWFDTTVEEEAQRRVEQVAAFITGSPDRMVLGAFELASDPAMAGFQPELVGTCCVGRESSLKARHRGFMRSLYVHPDHRHTGLGKALLDRACHAGRDELGLSLLRVEVSGSLASPAIRKAHELYLRYGFQPADPVVTGLGGDVLELSLVEERVL